MVLRNVLREEIDEEILTEFKSKLKTVPNLVLLEYGSQFNFALWLSEIVFLLSIMRSFAIWDKYKD